MTKWAWFDQIKKPKHVNFYLIWYIICENQTFHRIFGICFRMFLLSYVHFNK